ncbi:hypothetical protein RHGRI_005447 [Rhododendron griersonianum]|uniref:Uncharacterized protein n=1 Tax=Rhododendron griersonianum TaxID=479676 RepID=A0AAV6LEU8_9ERIC|nr:hypothetical protein RHGRI_005447 [Rhododendron griersonianum]
MSKIQSMSDQITSLCKRTVVSTTPVQPEKFHHLSALDRVMEPNRLIQMVYYYRTPPGRAVGAVTKKLRESISELLNSFPMVAGRLLTLLQKYIDKDLGHLV